MDTHHQFECWIDRISQAETPDETIIAYNFGLFETTKGYTIYLIGTKEFDELDEDWATTVDFQPKEKYLELNPIEVKHQQWQQILELAKNMIKNYLNSENFENSILKNAKAITTGFDDGNLTRLR